MTEHERFSDEKLTEFYEEFQEHKSITNQKLDTIEANTADLIRFCEGIKFLIKFASWLQSALAWVVSIGGLLYAAYEGFHHFFRKVV